jgi:predicted nucleotidyltransferase
VSETDLKIFFIESRGRRQVHSKTERGQHPHTVPREFGQDSKGFYGADRQGLSCQRQGDYLLDKGKVIKIVDRFRQGIEARGVKAQKVILYGSHAYGTSTIESDIDIVVISEDFSGKGFWERIDILSDVIYEISAPLEAVALTPDEWERGESFIVDFARDGEVLYAA